MIQLGPQLPLFENDNALLLMGGPFLLGPLAIDRRVIVICSISNAAVTAMLMGRDGEVSPSLLAEAAVERPLTATASVKPARTGDGRIGCS
jgi:hypothetical protein